MLPQPLVIYSHLPSGSNRGLVCRIGGSEAVPPPELLLRGLKTVGPKNLPRVAECLKTSAFLPPPQVSRHGAFLQPPHVHPSDPGISVFPPLLFQRPRAPAATANARVRHSIDYDPIKRRTEMEKQRPDFACGETNGTRYPLLVVSCFRNPKVNLRHGRSHPRFRVFV